MGALRAWASTSQNLIYSLGFPGFSGGSVLKNPPANAGDAREEDLIPGSGRSPEVGHGNPRPVSLPGNPHGQRRLAGYSPQGS